MGGIGGFMHSGGFFGTLWKTIEGILRGGFAGLIFSLLPLIVFRYVTGLVLSM
jgi:hypothetical protein